MRLSFFASAFLAVVVHAADLASQPPEPPLPAGAFARVTLTRHATDARRWRRDARRWRGTIEQAAADSFRLRLRDGRAWTFAWDDLAQLERHGGRVSRSESAWHGMVVGGVAGALLLGAVGVVEANTCQVGCDFVGLAPVVGIVIGGTAGGAAGAVLGAATPGERWERVALPRRTALLVLPRRIGVTIALAR